MYSVPMVNADAAWMAVSKKGRELEQEQEIHGNSNDALAIIHLPTPSYLRREGDFYAQSAYKYKITSKETTCKCILSFS